MSTNITVANASAYQIVPTFTDAFYDMVVNFEGTNYLLTFAYNQREACYYFSIGTPDGDEIVNGIKIVANWPLLHKWADDRLPPGDLFCLANTPQTDPAPDLGQIGVNALFTLYYVPAALLPGGSGP